jgi:glycosyltransferase involved in cell wall biosynthesis
MTQIRFSIATPTRNSLDKLRRCVGSVRGQHGVPLEHLIQDAGSSDGTPEWLSGHGGLRFVSEPDGGMYDAINRAWENSGGEFLSWLNADEQYLPGTLAKVQACFDANPTVDVVFGDYIVADAQGRPVALRREIPFRRAYAANGCLFTMSCTLFFRRRLLDDGLLHLDSRYRYAADLDLMLRLAEAGTKIARIPDYLAIFGIDGGNLSARPRMELETESIRLAHGAFRSRALRQLVLSGRHLERLIRGGYRRQSIRYHYATDELPRYVLIEANQIGGRYNLADIAGRTNAMSQFGFPL